MLRIRHLLIALVPLLAAACGSPAAAPSPTPTAAAVPTSEATASPASTAPPAGAMTFTVASGSKATVRVREQLANVPAPSDAVLTATGVSGSFTLRPDGSFAPGSKIEVQLSGLSSDSGQRDTFVKNDTLATRQFPTATFVPKTASGVSFPLASGSLPKLAVTGDMTVRGTTKEVTFDVTATRSGSTLTVSAMNAPTWTFGDFGLRVPRVLSVLSIVDEIRLEVQLVANEVRG